MHSKIAALAVGTTFAVSRLAQHLYADHTPPSKAPPLPHTSAPLTETPEARQLRARLRSAEPPRKTGDPLEEDTIREMIHAIFR